MLIATVKQTFYWYLWANHGLFCLFSFFSRFNNKHKTNIQFQPNNLKKRRCYSWDSNLGSQVTKLLKTIVNRLKTKPAHSNSYLVTIELTIIQWRIHGIFKHRKAKLLKNLFMPMGPVSIISKRICPHTT